MVTEEGGLLEPFFFFLNSLGFGIKDTTVEFLCHVHN